MRYAEIKTIEVANGTGIGTSLFVQGCHKHCEGCFNPETWDFNGGKAWTELEKDYILQLLEKPFRNRLSIVGGEPLDNENIEGVTDLVKEVKKRFGNTKEIWLYTGHLFEDVKDLEVVNYLDVIVDGSFMIDLKNISLRFRGSKNQRLIDVPKTLEKGEVVEWGK